MSLWAELRIRTMLGPVAVGCCWQQTSNWVLDVCVCVWGGEPQCMETLVCEALSILPFVRNFCFSKTVFRSIRNVQGLEPSSSAFSNKDKGEMGGKA